MLVEQPHAGAWGLGARRYVALYGGACYDRTWRSSRPCYARRLNFHVRLVCAHSPNSPAGVASTPFWGGGGWGGTSASPYWAKSASAWSYFAVASACSRFASRIAALACSTASSALRFSLLAAQPRQRSLSLASLRSSPRCAAESSTALSAAAILIAYSCCPFHSARVRRWRRGPNLVCPHWTETWLK